MKQRTKRRLLIALGSLLGWCGAVLLWRASPLLAVLACALLAALDCILLRRAARQDELAPPESLPQPDDPQELETLPISPVPEPQQQPDCAPEPERPPTPPAPEPVKSQWRRPWDYVPAEWVQSYKRQNPKTRSRVRMCKGVLVILNVLAMIPALLPFVRLQLVSLLELGLFAAAMLLLCRYPDYFDVGHAQASDLKIGTGVSSLHASLAGVLVCPGVVLDFVFLVYRALQSWWKFFFLALVLAAGLTALALHFHTLVRKTRSAAGLLAVIFALSAPGLALGLNELVIPVSTEQASCVIESEDLQSDRVHVQLEDGRQLSAMWDYAWGWPLVGREVRVELYQGWLGISYASVLPPP